MACSSVFIDLNKYYALVTIILRIGSTCLPADRSEIHNIAASPGVRTSPRVRPPPLLSYQEALAKLGNTTIVVAVLDKGRSIEQAPVSSKRPRVCL